MIFLNLHNNLHHTDTNSLTLNFEVKPAIKLTLEIESLQFCERKSICKARLIIFVVVLFAPHVCS